ncbi:MAG: DUF4383 domain-containing protein [Leptolyngbyaceae cyanobacterium]
MKAAQKFALALGVVYTLVGVLGFIPGLVSQLEVADTAINQYVAAAETGYLFGLLPVTNPLNVIHIATGLVSIAAAIALDSSRFISGQIGIYYSLFTVLGLLPFANTFFGLFPLYGYEVVFHGITGLLSIYFGFFGTPSLLKVLKQELREDAIAAEILS